MDIALADFEMQQSQLREQTVHVVGFVSFWPK